MDRQEVAFFGKISAAMTHDIRNVLAIIRESSGLMLDLLGMCEEGAFVYQQKFKNVLTGIQDQVNRGVELAAHFNRFAHSMDQPMADVDANEMVQQVVYLMQRFARLRKVQLLASTSDQPCAIRTDVFALHRLLGDCIHAFVLRAEEGDTIVVKAGKSDGGAAFTILAERSGLFLPTPGAEVPEAFVEISEYLKGAGGELQWVALAEGDRLVLTFRSSPAGGA
jgi:C4-dicarboxylate-specific signal transduction histidine kinase